MEYMEGGSLTDAVTTNFMTEDQIAIVCREVSEIRMRPFDACIGFGGVIASPFYWCHSS